MKNIFPKAKTQSQMTQEQALLQMLKANPQLMKKYQEELTKMQSQNKISSTYQPMTNKQYINKLKNKQIEKLLDEEGGLVIKPDEGFVLKFIDKRTQQKIFVNVVKHEAVDHPQEKQLVDFDNQTGLRIPMSMGRIREDHDKNGNICKVVDVVMNPQIVDTAQTNNDIFIFMGQIIGNYLLEKYKIAVSEQILKKIKGLKYKGSGVEIQRVKAKKAPKIEQLSQQKIQQKKQTQQQRLFNQMNGQFQNQKKIARPDFRIYIISQNGQKQEYSFDNFKKENIASIQIVFDLSLLIHSRGIHLEGSKQFVYLLVKGFYQVCLKMPVEIQTFKAKFGCKERKLLIQGIALKQKKQSQIQVIEGEVKFDQIRSSNKGQDEEQSQTSVKKSIKIQFQNELLDQLV